jgi:hypothetical protein
LPPVVAVDDGQALTADRLVTRDPEQWQCGRISNSRRVPEFADGFLPTRSCLDQALRSCLAVGESF